MTQGEGQRGTSSDWHVWVFTNSRRRNLQMLTKKRYSKHDAHVVPARWPNSAAARAWLRRETERGEDPDKEEKRKAEKETGKKEEKTAFLAAFGGVVLKCECGPGFGMGDHGS